MNMETQNANQLNEFLDRIEKSKLIHRVSLDDYPLSNRYAQTIEERVNDIIFSLEEFQEYVKDEEADDIIKTLWLRKLSDKEIINDLLNLELLHPIETSNEPIKTIGDIVNEDKVPKNEVEKKSVEDLKGKLEDFKTIITKSLGVINNIWLIIKSIDGVEFKESNPSIKQVYDYSALLIRSNFIESNNDKVAPSWDKLCGMINSCYIDKSKAYYSWLVTIILGLVILAISSIGILALCNRENIFGIDLCKNGAWIYCIFLFMCISAIIIVIVLLFHKFIHFQSKKCESDTKLKEKMMNAVIEAFHEDRDFGRLKTKTEIALREKLEKARIDEWCRNKEYERKLNIMEQERIAELSNVLKELAKTMNKVTIMDNQEKQDKTKTITIERSILCNDCCNEIKEMVNAAISKGDDNE